MKFIPRSHGSAPALVQYIAPARTRKRIVLDPVVAAREVSRGHIVYISSIPLGPSARVTHPHNYPCLISQHGQVPIVNTQTLTKPGHAKHFSQYLFNHYQLEILFLQIQIRFIFICVI